MENCDFDERAGMLALNRIFGFEPIVGKRLLETLGSAKEAFGMKREDLRELIGPYPKYLDALIPQKLDEARKELEDLGKRGFRFLDLGMEEYPELLRECEDPPIGLYVRASAPLGEIFGRRPKIAVVGTRDISPYGRQWCSTLVRTMARCPVRPTIVSGLAIGTDIIAQRTALEEGLPTIGAMATGIDSVYPYRHTHDAAMIAAAPASALVTDYPPGTQPLAIHFLRRNRIIAGLSEATILIESKIRGGGMMTARLAFSYQRDVYALPGRIDDVRSQGCNYMLREKIAEPFTDIDELMERLGLGNGPARQRRDLESEIRQALGDMVPEERLPQILRIAGMIREKRGISLPELCAETGWDWQDVAYCTGMLENGDIIETDLLQKCWIKTRNL